MAAPIAVRAQTTPVTAVVPLPAGAEAYPVKLSRMRLDLDGASTLAFQIPPCNGRIEPEPIERNLSGLTETALLRAFRDRIVAAGFQPAGDPTDLFESADAADTDFSIAAVVTRISGNLCPIPRYFGLGDESKGDLEMQIEWQIYGARERRVIARVPTNVHVERTTSRGTWDELVLRFLPELALSGFSESLDQLTASQAFRTAFIKAPAAATAETPASKALITMTGPAGPGTMEISDAVGSVVMLITAGGSGSGVLIGAEGYIVTNAHVVEDFAQITVRWSDGFETVADVIRKDDRRDVALIKTRSRGRAPLAVSLAATRPGEDVYAIGSPLGEEFQNSVTRGVISANRTIDGMAFIQSDVNVTHGSSGGALLNARGQLMGITQSGQERGGVSLGLNYFVPAQDILDFLNLELRPAEIAAP